MTFLGRLLRHLLRFFGAIAVEEPTAGPWSPRVPQSLDDVLDMVQPPARRA